MQLSANQEPHPPPASTPDVEENGPIIKNSVKCYFTPPKSQFYDGIFYQVVKWFSRGLSRTLSGCIPPELARDGLQPRKVPDRPRENHFTTRLKIPELNWFFGWV